MIVSITIDAMAPEDLPHPTQDLRWFETDKNWWCPVVQITGEAELVLQFVRDHWGAETVDDQYDSGFAFLAAHLVKDTEIPPDQRA